MAETISELVVKINADIGNFQNNIDRATSNIQKAGEKIQSFGKSISMAVTVPLVALGVAAVKAFGDSEKASAEFAQALRVTGKTTEISTANIAAMAKQLQQVTIYEDDATMSALAMVQQLANLSEEGLKQITPLMQDFASAMGIDLQQAATMIGKTLGSNVNAFARYGVEIDATASKSDKLQQLTEQLASKFKGSAQAAAEAGTGPILQLKNTLGDMSEDIGKILLPTVLKMAAVVKTMAEKFSQLNDSQKQVIVTIGVVAASIGPLLMTLGKFVTVLPQLVAGFTALRSAAAMGALVAGGPIALGIVAITAGLGLMFMKLNQYAKDNPASTQLAQGFYMVSTEVDRLNAKFAITDRQFIAISGQLKTIDFNAPVSGAQQLDYMLSQMAQKLGLTREQLLEAGLRTADLDARTRQLIQTEYDRIVKTREQREATQKANNAAVEAAKAEADRLMQLRASQEEQAAAAKEVADLMAAAAAQQAVSDQAQQAANEKQLASDKLQAEATAILTQRENDYNKAIAEGSELLKKQSDADAAAAAKRKKTIQDITNASFQPAKNITQAFSEAFNSINDRAIKAIENALSKELAAISKETQARLIAAGVATKTDQQVLQEKLDAAIATGDAIAIKEAQDALTRQQILDEQAVKEEEAKRKAAIAIAKIQRKQAEQNKIIALAELAINTAQAIMQAYTLGPIVGSIATAGILALSGVQAAVIQSTPLPPIPAYARGTDYARGGLSRINEEGGEVVNLPMGASVTPATRTLAGQNGAGITVNIYSPKEVSAYEANNIFKATARQLAYEEVFA